MNQESKEMLNILQNLENAQNSAQKPDNVQNNVQNSAQPSTGNVSPDAQEMFNILNKLEQATEAAASRVINESVSGEPVIVAKDAEGSQIGVGEFHISITESRLAGKFKKKYYTISDEQGILYEDLALFESAMAIVKHLTHGGDESVVEEIADLDLQYGNKLNEAATYKIKMNTLAEEHRIDVAAAKHSAAIGKMSSIKRNIKKLL